MTLEAQEIQKVCSELQWVSRDVSHLNQLKVGPRCNKKTMSHVGTCGLNSLTNLETRAQQGKSSTRPPMLNHTVSWRKCVFCDKWWTWRGLVGNHTDVGFWTKIQYYQMPVHCRGEHKYIWHTGVDINEFLKLKFSMASELRKIRWQRIWEIVDEAPESSNSSCGTSQ